MNVQSCCCITSVECGVEERRNSKVVAIECLYGFAFERDKGDYDKLLKIAAIHYIIFT